MVGVISHCQKHIVFQKSTGLRVEQFHVRTRNHLSTILSLHQLTQSNQFSFIEMDILLVFSQDVVKQISVSTQI